MIQTMNNSAQPLYNDTKIINSIKYQDGALNLAAQQV